MSIFANSCVFFFLSLSISMCENTSGFVFFSLFFFWFVQLCLLGFYTLAHIVYLPTAITTFKNTHQLCELFVFISCCFVGFCSVSLSMLSLWSCTHWGPGECVWFYVCADCRGEWINIIFSRIFFRQSNGREYRGIVECCDSYWHRQEIRFAVTDNIYIYAYTIIHICIERGMEKESACITVASANGDH